MREWRKRNRIHLSEYNRQYRAENRAAIADKKAQYDRAYYAKNAERILARNAIYQAARKEQTRERVRAWKAQKRASLPRKRCGPKPKYRTSDEALAARRVSRRTYKQRNPSTVARDRAARRAREAAPAWANREHIDLYYFAASVLSKRLGTSLHVDHVIPLRGRTVCGLHTPENLRIVTATVNMAKGNRFPYGARETEQERLA